MATLMACSVLPIVEFFLAFNDLAFENFHHIEKYHYFPGHSSAHLPLGLYCLLTQAQPMTA